MSDIKVTTFSRLLKLNPIRKAGSVVIAGGGISGLSFAYFLGLLRPDLKLTLLEKSPRFGGYIKSQLTSIKDKEDTILEKGPRTLRGVSTGTLLIADILHRTNNLDVINGVHLSSDGNKKYLLGKNVSGDVEPQLIEVPSHGHSIKDCISFLSTSPGRKAILGTMKNLCRVGSPDQYNPKRDLSVEEFFTRHFGKGMINEVGSAIMYGVYAADVKDLSIRCVMPRMAAIGEESPSLIRHAVKSLFTESKTKNKAEILEREIEQKDDAFAVAALDPDVKQYVEAFKSDLNMVKLKDILKRFPMLALTGGLETLTKILKENMPSNVELLTNEGLKTVRKSGEKVSVTTSLGRDLICDHFRSTIGANELKNAFKETKDLSDTFDSFKYTSVTVTNVYIKKNVKDKKGFGFLIPKAYFNEEVRLMGVIFDSDVESSAKSIFNPEITTEILSNSLPNATELGKMAANVHKSKEDTYKDFTKVTFMFNINPTTREVASDSKMKQIIKNVFESLLGADLSSNDWFIERNHWMDAIPLYDVEFLARKKQLFSQLESNFGSTVSLGGMTFAQGVGVPDCVVTSFKDSFDLSK